MKAISKKLLSMLVVVAMVLSMVPFGGLGILAVETNATEVAQTFDPANNEGVAYCPACQEEVTWEVYAGGKDSSSGLWAEDEAAHFHLYLDADLTYTTNALVSYRNVCFNLNGFDVTAQEGASYAFNCSRTMNLMDTAGGAVVTGYANAITSGAAVHVNAGNAAATCNIYGGTYTKLAADTKSAIVYIGGNGGKINMYDGAVIDARSKTTAQNSPAPGVGLLGHPTYNAEFTMYGGTIYGGTGTNYGGAVTVGMWSTNYANSNGAFFTMKGGTVDGGTTTEYGGNFKVQYGGTLNLEGGTVKNGSAGSYGGAMFVNGGTLNMSGDATVYAGDVTSGNYDGIALAKSTMTMSGNSKVYGTGTSWGNALYVYNGSTLILSGNATVKNETGSSSANIYVLYNATTPNNLRIANDWAGEAYMFTEKGSSSGRYAAGDTIDSTTGGYCGALSDGAISTPGGTYAGRLYYSTTGTLVLGEEGALVVSALTSIPEVGKFEPEKNNGMAYCPACMAQGTNLQPVEWTVYTGEYNTTANKLTGGEHAHLYLTADLSYAAANYALISGQNVCFNLNGCDITAASGAYSAFDVSATLNLMDTAGGAVVTGNSTSMYVGSAVQVNNAATVCNIYGGTYTKLAADTNSAIVYITSNGGKVNMYDGAVIDARNLANTLNRAAPGVGVVGTSSTKAEFTMYGGTIYGGTGVNLGGAVTVGMWVQSTGYTNNGAVFTMKGGTVDGGATTVTGTDSNAEYGGNFKVQYGGTLNLEGGTVKNGSAYKYGGAIFVTAGTLNMSGDATVYAGDVTSGGFDGIVLANASTMTMSGNSKVYGTGTSWGNALYAYNGSTVTLSGNATVKNESGSSGSNIYILYSTSKPNNLRIANDWAGEAYMFTEKDGDGGRYASGDTIDSTYGGYCGALADGTVTKGGSFNGSLYLGNYGIFGENGDLILGVTSVVSKDGTTKWYASNQAAVDAAANNPDAYVLMSSSDTVTLSGDTYILINGHNITVNGSGTLYPMDKANDDFDGYGSFTVDETNITIETDVTNPVNGYRYAIMRNAAGKYNAHRIEIKLTAVTLRAGEAGLYYKAEYKCDDALAGRISAYGVVLSVKDMPDADFLYSTDGFSCLESGFVPDEDHVVTATSGSVFGIFKDATERPATEEKTTAQLNAEYGMKTIYANAYFLVDLQGDGDTTNDNVYVSDTKNGGKQKHDSAAANYDADFDGVAYSLWDVMKTINDQWDTLIGDDENKQGLIKNFLDTWMNDEVVDSSIWDWSELPEITALGA